MKPSDNITPPANRLAPDTDRCWLALCVLSLVIYVLFSQAVRAFLSEAQRLLVYL